MAHHTVIPQQCNEDSWLIEPLSGTITHRAMGLRLRVEPTVRGLMRYGRQAELESQGLRVVGQCELPQGTPDFRTSDMLDDGPAGREFAAWAVLADRDSVDSALRALEEHADNPRAELARLLAQAGAKWIDCVRSLRHRRTAESA